MSTTKPQIRKRKKYKSRSLWLQQQKKYKWVWYFIFALLIMGTVSMFSPAGKIISVVKNKMNNMKLKMKNKEN
tara:strand:+ start:376 stop:594 length:219 start_codon:yes stop_codon:yes gene_type:complete